MSTSLPQRFTVVTLAERPELINHVGALHALAWPAFIRKDQILGEKWTTLLETFPELQYFMVSDEGNIMACGHALPFEWTGREEDLPQGWEAVFEKGLNDQLSGNSVNAASAIAIVIHPNYRGKGLSEEMVWAMKKIVRDHSLDYMVAPLRPALKAHYPLIPMEDYMNWTRTDGEAFDPWIRAHMRTGAHRVKVAEASTVIEASIKDWEDWTGLTFLSSGHYVISGGLVPLTIHLDTDTGRYEEPNVWMSHDVHKERG